MAVDADVLHAGALSDRQYACHRVVPSSLIRADLNIRLLRLSGFRREVAFELSHFHGHSVPQHQSVKVDRHLHHFGDLCQARWLAAGICNIVECVIRGSVMMNMIRSTNMTSISGVVLISIIGSPSPPLPTFIAMSCYLSLSARAISGPWGRAR